MVEFDFKGIKVEATVVTERYDYKDANYKAQTRFNRNVVVSADFWNFRIVNDLYDLAFVRSTLNYFMHCYWKRTSKEGHKIELAKELHYEDVYTGKKSLIFTARQKDKKHFLQICLQQGGSMVNEVYLDGQEVIMLDIAIIKAINLLSPCNNQEV